MHLPITFALYLCLPQYCLFGHCVCKGFGLLYAHPLAMSKEARWPKTDVVSQENVFGSYNLANDAACRRVCSVGTRGCVCLHEATSSTPHWPVGRDSLIGQGALRFFIEVS